MGVYILTSIIAILVAGVILVISIRLYPSFRIEETHWLFILACVVVTSFTVAIAIQSSQCIKAIDNKAETMSLYSGLLGRIMDIDIQESSYSPMAYDVLKSLRETQKQRIYKSLWISLIIAITVNILLFFLLRKSGQSSHRRKTHKGYSSDNNYTSSIDNF